MTKKGPLGKAEKFYIEHHRDVDVKELCKELDRAQVLVKRFIDSLPTEKTAPISKGKKETVLSKQFARNEKNGVTVMTPNASIMADSKRADFSGTKVRSDCTTKIKD